METIYNPNIPTHPLTLIHSQHNNTSQQTSPQASCTTHYRDATIPSPDYNNIPQSSSTVLAHPLTLTHPLNRKDDTKMLAQLCNVTAVTPGFLRHGHACGGMCSNKDVVHL